MDKFHSILLLLFLCIAFLNFLDYASTKLILDKGRGFEGNPVMVFATKYLGSYWPLVKLLFIPICAGLWYVSGRATTPAILGAFIIALYYAYTVINNYMIAWRK